MRTSFFDLDNRYAGLSKGGDSLERLNAVIDWEIFRPLLERIDSKERKSTAGRKPTCRCSCSSCYFAAPAWPVGRAAAISGYKPAVPHAPFWS